MNQYQSAADYITSQHSCPGKGKNSNFFCSGSHEPFGTLCYGSSCCHHIINKEQSKSLYAPSYFKGILQIQQSLSCRQPYLWRCFLYLPEVVHQERNIQLF